MRIANAAPEADFYGTYRTNNYVKYQGSYPGYTDLSNPYESTVMSCAVGIYNVSNFVGLATANTHAKTSHNHLINKRQRVKASSPYTDVTWKGFGGADVEPGMAHRMQSAQASLKLVFYYPSIQPGETVSFDLGYVFNYDEVNHLMDSLTTMFIVEPTDILSGSRALVVAAVLKSKTYDLLSCDVSIFGYQLDNPNNISWVTLPLHDVVLIKDSNSSYFYCASFVDVSGFADGIVQLSVVANTLNSTITKLRTVSVANLGKQLCFEQEGTPSNPIHFHKFGSYNFSMSEKCLSNVTSTSAANVTAVTYYLETLTNGEVSSYLLQSTSSAPYDLTLTINEYIFPKLTNWSVCFIKAVIDSIPVTSLLSNSTVAILSGIYFPEVLASTAIHHVLIPTDTPIHEPTYEPTFEPTGTLNPFGYYSSDYLKALM